jgi:hypothetical protein
MGAAARVRAEREFSLQTMVDGYRTLLQSVVGEVRQSQRVDSLGDA